MNGVFVAGLLAGYGVAVPVGAVATYLVTLAAERGWRVGAAGALGVATTDGLYALLAVFAGGALVPALARVETPLRIGSALVLAALGVRILYRAGRAPDGHVSGQAPGPVRSYLNLVALTAVNPTTVIYFTALVLGAPRNAGVFFAVAAFLASASWQLLLAGGGTLLGRVLTGRAGRLGTAIVAGTLILALAVRQAWPG